MGAWGHLPFQNDTALDWVYEVEETPELETLSRAFSAVLGEDGAEDADEGTRAVAAAAVLAAIRGVDTDRTGLIPDDLAEFVIEHSGSNTDSLATLAAAALAAVLGSDSELAELWEEGVQADDDPSEWRTGVELLAAAIENG